MFFALRDLLGLILIFLIIWLFKRRGIRLQIRSILMLIVISSFIATLTIAFPIENVFVTFDNPSDVISYFRRGVIKKEIIGEESALALFTVNDNPGFPMIIPSNGNGFIIPSIISSKEINHIIYKGISIQIYSVRNTNDYYVIGSTFNNDKPLTVNDEEGRTLEIISIEHQMQGISTRYFFVYVKNLTNESYIIINDNKVLLRSNLD